MAGKLRPDATGAVIRREMRSLFRQQRLYRPTGEKMRVLWRGTADGFSVVKVEFDLECGLPVRGCLGIPDRGIRGWCCWRTAWPRRRSVASPTAIPTT